MKRSYQLAFALSLIAVGFLFVPLQKRHCSTAQAAETASTKIKHAWQDLVEAKKELTQELEYMCCIKPACNFCALAESKCSCSDTLESEGVCGECKGGWEAGAGAVASVKAADVKVAAGTLKKMYENVRKQQREATR